MIQTIETVRAVVARVSYPGVTFQVKTDGTRPMVRVSCPDGVCNVTGAPVPWNGRWHRLSYHMTDGEIAQTCFLAVILANEHEARESFKVDGVPVFQPHFDLDALVRFAKDRENTKERPHFPEPARTEAPRPDCPHCSGSGKVQYRNMTPTQARAACGGSGRRRQ